MTEEKDVVFWGCGRQALVLSDMLRDEDYRIAFAISDDLNPPLFDTRVVRSEHLEGNLHLNGPDPIYFVIAIGGVHGEPRLDRYVRMKHLGFQPLTLVHPTATLLSGALIGEACQVLARAVIGVGARLGNAVIVNTGAIIDHEAVIGDGCHMAPGSVLLGRVLLGDRVFIGANATVLPDLSICSDVIVGAGSVVVRDISQPGTYVGAPARLLSKH